MIKTALSLSAALLVFFETSVVGADTYPDSFADFLNARGLYFDYEAAAENSYWVQTSSGDVVLSMPSAVAPEISVVWAEEAPSDVDISGIRADVEMAMSSALDRLGIRRCLGDAPNDQAACIPFVLQVGFSARHDDVVISPPLRNAGGRQMGGLPTRHFVSHDRRYAMACGTSAETSAVGEVRHLDAAFTVEVSPSGSDVFLLQPIASEIEKCLLGLLGVSVVEDLPRGAIGYYVAQSLETLHKAESYLTRDQTANDIPELVMMHALRKALGKEPVLGQ